MFPIIETQAKLEYGPRSSYYNHGYELKDYGVKRYPYSDIDIVSLVSREVPPKRLRFHKVRDYINPSMLQFFIYDMESNRLVVTLFALLAQQRMYFETPDFGIFPRMEVTVNIVQDPNMKRYRWTGEYQ